MRQTIVRLLLFTLALLLFWAVVKEDMEISLLKALIFTYLAEEAIIQLLTK